MNFIVFVEGAVFGAAVLAIAWSGKILRDLKHITRSYNEAAAMHNDVAQKYRDYRAMIYGDVAKMTAEKDKLSN